MSEIDEFQLELGAGSELGMALALFVMMFAVALTLKFRHFVSICEAPKPFFIGIIGQLILLPLLTLVLCIVIEPRPSVALGMILVACCPGGNVSNMLVLLARGNAALSVTLTASSSVAAAFITPLAVVFWSSLYSPTARLLQEIAFEPWRFLVQTTIILGLPLLLGSFINSRVPVLAKKLSRVFIGLGTGLLVLIIVIAMMRYWGPFLSLGFGLIGIVVMHNACAFLLGYGLAKSFDLVSLDRRALTFEVGIQNSGLAIVIILSQLGGLGGAAAVAGLWGVWHIVGGLMLVAFFRLRPLT